MADPVRTRALLALAAGLVSLAVYAGDSNTVVTGDTLPATVLPVSILREGDLDLNEFPWRPERDYFVVRVGQRLLSFYSIVPGLVNLPAHAVAQALGHDTLREAERLGRWTASATSALSVAFLTLALLALCERRSSALVAAGVYAFGTATWSVTATGLWSQGPSLLFLTGALAALTGRHRGWLFAAGLLLGMAVWNRPPNAVFALAGTAYVVLHRREGLAWFFAGAALPAVAMVAYSWTHWGSPFALGQGHRLEGQHGTHHNDFRGPFLPNLAGTLLSPNRGLFVFSPILLLALPAGWRVLARPRAHPLIFPFTVAALAHLAVYSLWSTWWGGYQFGYRLLVEMLPVWAVLLALSWEGWLAASRAGRAAFAALAALSVYVNLLGALYYPSGWDREPESVDARPERVWDWHDTELGRLQQRMLGR